MNRRNKKSKVFLMTLLVLISLRVNGFSFDEKSQRAKEFIVMGYQGIIFEINSGSGAYIKTLMDLLNVSSDQKEQTLEKVRSLSKSNLNIMDFADQVLLLQGSNSSTLSTSAAVVPIPTGKSIYSGDKLENALNHLTRGMGVTIFAKSGDQYKGRFEEYSVKRLSIRGASKKSFHLNDILAIDAPDL